MAKVRLTEAQFKTYCRKLLNEKRSEDYAKDILNENRANFQPLKQPLMAFKLVQERYLNSFINNGFSNKFMGPWADGNMFGRGFYFVIDERDIKRMPVKYFGNILLSVEIQPGANAYVYNYLGKNDAIVVAPEDGSKIKIIKAEDIRDGKVLYGNETANNIYGDNWTTTIAEQKLEKMIAESVKKVLKEGIDGAFQSYKDKNGVIQDDFLTAYLKTISSTYSDPFIAAQIAVDGVLSAASAIGYKRYAIVKQMKNDYEKTEYHS